MANKRVLSWGLAAAVFIIIALLGGCLPAETPEGESGSILPLIIFMVLIFGMFYLLIMRPQRRRQKEQQALVSELKRGDRVITAGGIYGVVESTSDESVVIKVEGGTTLRVAKSSVVGRREK